MKKLLDAPNVHTVLGYRDRAVLELMYSTAMRRAEVEALKVEDVDFDGGFVRVNEGKGRKDRVVPLGKVAGKYLENYLKVIRPELVKDPMERGLFLGQYGNPLTGDVIWRMVKQYARKAGLTKNVYPHSFRHTCATLMMKNKANIRHIQELLGHASLLSTQVYTAVSIVDLKEAHRKYHPREREKG
jgi:integrase/recombinase XerD